MSTRDITDAFQEIYGADILVGLISQVSSVVMEKVTEWNKIVL
jgi:putative transposase